MLFGIAPNVQPHVEADGDNFVVPLSLEDDEVGYEDVEDISSDTNSDNGNNNEHFW